MLAIEFVQPFEEEQGPNAAIIAQIGSNGWRTIARYARMWPTFYLGPKVREVRNA